MLTHGVDVTAADNGGHTAVSIAASWNDEHPGKEAVLQLLHETISKQQLRHEATPGDTTANRAAIEK